MYKTQNLPRHGKCIQQLLWILQDLNSSTPSHAIDVELMDFIMIFYGNREHVIHDVQYVGQSNTTIFLSPMSICCHKKLVNDDSYTCVVIKNLSEP